MKRNDIPGNTGFHLFVLLLEKVMKKGCIIIITGLVFVLCVNPFVWAGEKSPQLEELRYHDADNDGKNDLFRDANGDGINDVTGKPYQHHFKFVDSNNDGKNDVFQDDDGNGFNDLAENDKGMKEAITHIVIDFDNDGINDVTGEKYLPEIGNRRFIDEDGDGINDTVTDKEKSSPQELARDLSMDRFVDEDGDGINDIVTVEESTLQDPGSESDKDRFVDEDGDGINDGRSFGRSERGWGRRRPDNRRPDEDTSNKRSR